MGTVPVFPSFTPGEKPPATKLNQMKDWADFMSAPPTCYAYQATLQSLANTGYPAIVLDGEVFDIYQTGDTQAHDPSGVLFSATRVYIRTPGKYWVSAQVQFATNATGVRAAQVRSNAAGSSVGGALVSTNQQSPLSSAGTSVTMPSVKVPFVAGDYLELFATQNSGGALNTVPGQGVTLLSVEWAGI